MRLADLDAALRHARGLRRDIATARRIGKLYADADPVRPTRIYGATIASDLGEQTLCRIGFESACSAVGSRIDFLTEQYARLQA